jgi:hypothetical protein
MMLSYDRRYGSHLVRDQGQLSILPELGRRRNGGTTCSWSNRSDLPCVQQLFNSRKGRFTSQHWQPLKWGRFDRACDQAHSVVQLDINFMHVNAIQAVQAIQAIQAVRNVCAPEPHFHSSFFQMWFIGKCSVQSRPKIFRVVNVSD